MSKILAFLALCAACAFAGPPAFEPVHTFELKKDEWARVIITEKATQKQDSFDFRWTIFDSTNIVVQSFFRRYPRQMVMSLRHGQNTYMQRVMPDFTMPQNDGVKLYVTFVKFENRKASFLVGIIDEDKRIDTEFIDPPTKK